MQHEQEIDRTRRKEKLLAAIPTMRRRRWQRRLRGTPWNTRGRSGSTILPLSLSKQPSQQWMPQHAPYQVPPPQQPSAAGYYYQASPTSQGQPIPDDGIRSLWIGHLQYWMDESLSLFQISELQYTLSSLRLWIVFVFVFCVFFSNFVCISSHKVIIVRFFCCWSVRWLVVVEIGVQIEVPADAEMQVL